MIRAPCWVGLLVLCACAAEGGAPRLVRSGAGFAYLRDERPREYLVVHIIRVDRSDAGLALHATLGGGESFGMATVSEQVRRLPRVLGEAVAALSGDYGDETAMDGPLGLHIERGELIRGPAAGRASFYVDASGRPHLEVIESRFAVVWPDGTSSPFLLNLFDRRGYAVLLSPVAGSREGPPDALQIAVRPPVASSLRIGETMQTEIVSVSPDGRAFDEPGQLVLAIPARAAVHLPRVAVGQKVGISTHTEPEITGATVGIGSGPALVWQHQPRSFNSPVRHPRAAVGWNEQYFYMVAVDGRSVQTSMGMTLSELAAYLAALGCDYAMNLDGGASTGLWLQGEMINRPAEKAGERPVPNALVLVRRPQGP